MHIAASRATHISGIAASSQKKYNKLEEADVVFSLVQITLVVLPDALKESLEPATELKKALQKTVLGNSFQVEESQRRSALFLALQGSKYWEAAASGQFGCVPVTRNGTESYERAKAADVFKFKLITSAPVTWPGE